MVAFTFWKRMNRFWCQLLTVVHEAAPLTRVRLATSRALQSQKWQLIRMSQWYRSALCGHPLPALTNNWTHGAASRRIIAPIRDTRPSHRHRSRSYCSFPVPLRVGGWVGLSMYITALENQATRMSNCRCKDKLYRLLDLTLLLMLFQFLPPPSGTISLRMFDHVLARPLSDRD